MKLVLIHGRAQGGKNPTTLLAKWRRALNSGLEKSNLTFPKTVSIEFPFYGDTLDKLIAQIEAPLLVDVIPRGARIDSPALQLQAALLAEMAAASGLKDDAIQKHYEGEWQERGLENARWVLAIAKALDRTPLGPRVIDRITHDVSVYLTNDGVRYQVDKIVREKLGDEPCVVVGHSLGSVVGYNVLFNAARADVRTYVTVGSPLGLEAVKANIDGPLAMPPCIRTKKWFNARDPKDIVAVVSLAKKNFDIDPPIKEKQNVKNWTENHHSIEGYLDDAQVARQIYQAL